MSLVFNSARIESLDIIENETDFPQNIEICLCKIPIRKKDGYSIDFMNQISLKLKNKMVKNGIVFFICYSPIEEKIRPFEMVSIMTGNGFTHIDTIVIEKTWLPGKRSETNLVNSYDMVFHFCNGDAWGLDREPIRNYLNTDIDRTCPGNVWRVETGSLEEAYPLDLAELLIRMADVLPGSLIFDPFMGTKASLLASLKLGHNFIGYEKDMEKIKIYEKILKGENKNDLQEIKSKKDTIG